MVRKKRGKSILGKKISNRLAYTIIAAFALILVGVFVWASTGTPNPGHNIQSIGAPSTCSVGQFLRYDGGSSNWWSCAPGGGVSGSGSAGQAAFWTSASAISGDNTFFWDNTNKRLGLGTTSPTSRLHVVGNTLITQNLTVDTSTLFVNSNLDRVGIRTLTPETSLDVNGSIRANLFYGDGSGLYNLRMIVTPVLDDCNVNTHGLMRYRGNYCMPSGHRASTLDVCMRTDDTIYSWINLKRYTWPDATCPGGDYEEGECPNADETYYECDDPSMSGCYVEEPVGCKGPLPA